MSEGIKTAAGALGGVATATVSALCCAGPVVAVAGISGAGVAATFEPLRPFFLAATGLFLAVAVHGAYSTSAEACVEKGECDTLEEALGKKRRQKAILWIAVILSGVLASLPFWAPW